LVVNTNGREGTLADATYTFAKIDSEFKNLAADEMGGVVGATSVVVWEMIKDGTFQILFGSLNSDLRKSCLKQNQIIRFVRKYYDWLGSRGSLTFFLLQSKGNFFVVRVGFCFNGSLSVSFRGLEYNYVWRSKDRHRFVVPFLEI